jgi:hypothetical protein
MSKCVHCGNEPEVGNLLPNGDRLYPLQYAHGYAQLLTTRNERYGLGSGCLRVEWPEDAKYVVLSTAMLRQMLADAEATA